MSIAFLQKILAGTAFIIAVVTLVVRLTGHQEPQLQPAPAIMTTQQAYDQICGHPDVCASMHDFIQQVQAEKQYLATPPTPAPAEMAQAPGKSAAPATH